jgi:predicted RNase H-like HicB family nuclease
MKYAIVIEKEADSFGAFVPDLPGCVAIGESEEDVRELIRQAIEFHLEALREEGAAIPPPSSSVDYIEVSPAA